VVQSLLADPFRQLSPWEKERHEEAVLLRMFLQQVLVLDMIHWETSCAKSSLVISTIEPSPEPFFDGNIWSGSSPRTHI
jgi:hypothetical protein